MQLYIILNQSSLSPLTILQDRNVGDVTLVCLVLRGDWRKFDIAGVEDGCQSAVNTAELLQDVIDSYLL